MPKTIRGTNTKIKETKSNNRLRVIDTLPKLTDYIRTQLGEPLIKVEVTDEQIENCIFDTIQLFGEYAYQGREYINLVIDIDDQNQKEFTLDSRVRAITSLRQTSNLSSFMAIIPGYVVSQSSSLTLTMLNTLNFADVTAMETSLARLSNLESIFDVNINYEFNEYTKKLIILEPLHKSQYMLLEAALDYEPKEIDAIYNHPWIKKMSKAQTKLMWGNNLGKFQGSIINGATINYDRIISEAQQEIDTLIEELKNTYMEPYGVWVR